MPRYNLALTPTLKIDEIVSWAKHFSNVADNYLLGEGSLPHVTLYQFDAEEKQIENIWKQLESVWKKNPIYLNFETWSCITFDNKIFWAALLSNESVELRSMHDLIAGLLNKPIKTNFDPHMTLFNTRNRDYEIELNIMKPLFKSIADTFVLSLGKTDAIGQLTEIIFSMK